MSADESETTPTTEEGEAEPAGATEDELEDLEPEGSEDSVTGGRIKGHPQTIVNFGS